MYEGDVDLDHNVGDDDGDDNNDDGDDVIGCMRMMIMVTF